MLCLLTHTHTHTHTHTQWTRRAVICQINKTSPSQSSFKTAPTPSISNPLAIPSTQNNTASREDKTTCSSENNLSSSGETFPDFTVFLAAHKLMELSGKSGLSHRLHQSERYRLPNGVVRQNVSNCNDATALNERGNSDQKSTSSSQDNGNRIITGCDKVATVSPVSLDSPVCKSEPYSPSTNCSPQNSPLSDTCKKISDAPVDGNSSDLALNEGVQDNGVSGVEIDTDDCSKDELADDEEKMDVQPAMWETERECALQNGDSDIRTALKEMVEPLSKEEESCCTRTDDKIEKDKDLKVDAALFKPGFGKCFV